MILIRPETAQDAAARERLLDACFGENRLAKTSQRLRDGRVPADGLSLSAQDARGRLVGTVRLWHVEAGHVEAGQVEAGHACPALLLGPLAVDGSARGQGLGARLMHAILARASGLGHAAVVLVGDAPYYARFGFSPSLCAGLAMPGPFERERLLGLELRDGALANARGCLRATGAFEAPAALAVESAARAARRHAA